MSKFGHWTERAIMSNYNLSHMHHISYISMPLLYTVSGVTGLVQQKRIVLHKAWANMIAG